MKKNWIKIVGALCIGALALTGCKKGGDTKTGEADKTEAPAKTDEKTG